MDRTQALKEVSERLKDMQGLRGFFFLDDTTRETVRELEKQAEKEGAVHGLMRFVNQGLWVTLERQEQCALVLSKQAILTDLARDLLQIVDAEGHILGEWVNREIETPKQPGKSARYIARDFVMYPEETVHGEPYFVIPEVDFPFLFGTPGIKNVTSGSPSSPTGEYILNHLGITEPEHWTHLVGFDLDLDDKSSPRGS